MEDPGEYLSAQLKGQGLLIRIVSASHVADLKAQIESDHTEGLLEDKFFNERLQFYQFGPTEALRPAESMIIIAKPRPQTPVNFSAGRKTLTLTLPPTYARYSAITREVGEVLQELLKPSGYQVTEALLPLKLLAACSGLAEYGRNNVCYIEGMGSFFELMAYYSDMPCIEDSWQQPQMLPRCKTCEACRIQCPTGAITDERFLLHAERCLTYLNESAATRPFPAEINPAIHNALMGCMLCQRFCPEDKPFLSFFEQSVDFSEQETAMLLHGAKLGDFPAETIRKLDYLELSGDLDKLPRNLGVFFNPL
jgi:epoxyqueuosine reductase